MDPMTMMAMLGGGEGGGAGGAAGMNPWMLGLGALAGAVRGHEKQKSWRQQRDMIAAKEAMSPWTRLNIPQATMQPSAMDSILRGVAMGASLGQGKGEGNPWGAPEHGNQGGYSTSPQYPGAKYSVA